MGLVAGGYIYLTGFAGFVQNLAVPDSEKVNQFVIVGDSYGGCRSYCPSFQVQADGSYRYLFTPEIGQPEALREGTISRGLLRDLKDSLNERDLRSQSRVYTPDDCESYVDGIDVVYTVTLNGTQYEIDSCGTDVDWDGELWVALNALWTELAGDGNN